MADNGGTMTDSIIRAMGRRSVMKVIIAASAAMATPAAWAAGGPAEAYVSQIAGEVMALANSGLTGNGLRDKFSALLNRYINFHGIADYALGQYRSQIPSGEQAEFYRLVSNYAAALFVFYVSDFRGNSLAILSTTQQGKFTVIQSAIRGQGLGGELVRWRLLPNGGSFRVSDVNIKGVWLTIAMHDRFTKVMAKSKGGYNALFDELRQAETW